MVKNLSVRKCLQDIERCSLCGNLDNVLFFDMDHKIPTFLGGPNSRWNIWPVCLRCHRAKCHYESSGMWNSFSKKCFSCQRNLEVNSSNHAIFWCDDCRRLPFHIRVLNLECNIKKNMNFLLK
jgi:hypothetical protein